MDALTLLLFGLGLVLLVGGAELLVRGASGLAATIGISPLVIGLTVVAFGTSAPETAVSVQSALLGQADLAVGNVVGSNIFNVLFILGLSALVTPLVVSRQLVRADVPVMIGVSLLLLVLAWNGSLSRLEGLVLFSGALLYTLLAVRQGRKSGNEAAQAAGSETRTPWALPRQLAAVVGGLFLLVLGSRWLVSGAVAIASALGVSELIIGLTVVAAGTSLPEVATSVIASLRGERDIAVGNVVGSNIFNVLLVLGLASLVAPSGIPVPAAVLAFDLPIMIAAALACLPIFFTGYRIDRWEGGLFLAYYLAYLSYLIMTVTGHAALPLFGAAMLFFVLPLTFLTLAVVSWRALGARDHSSR